MLYSLPRQNTKRPIFTFLVCSFCFSLSFVLNFPFSLRHRNSSYIIFHCYSAWAIWVHQSAVLTNIVSFTLSFFLITNKHLLFLIILVRGIIICIEYNNIYATLNYLFARTRELAHRACFIPSFFLSPISKGSYAKYFITTLLLHVFYVMIEIIKLSVDANLHCFCMTTYFLFVGTSCLVKENIVTLLPSLFMHHELYYWF